MTYFFTLQQFWLISLRLLDWSWWNLVYWCRLTFLHIRIISRSLWPTFCAPAVAEAGLRYYFFRRRRPRRPRQQCGISQLFWAVPSSQGTPSKKYQPWPQGQAQGHLLVLVKFSVMFLMFCSVSVSFHIWPVASSHGTLSNKYQPWLQGQDQGQGHGHWWALVKFLMLCYISVTFQWIPSIFGL